MYIKSRKFQNIQILYTIYFPMTQPILQYGITARDGLSIVVSNKTPRAQKSIIKIIFNKPKTYSTNKLFEGFEVFTIQ